MLWSVAFDLILTQKATQANKIMGKNGLIIGGSMKLSIEQKNLLFLVLESNQIECKQDLNVIKKRESERELNTSESEAKIFLESRIASLDQLMDVLEKSLEG